MCHFSDGGRGGEGSRIKGRPSLVTVINNTEKDFIKNICVRSYLHKKREG